MQDLPMLPYRLQARKGYVHNNNKHTYFRLAYGRWVHYIGHHTCKKDVWDTRKSVYKIAHEFINDPNWSVMVYNKVEGQEVQSSAYNSLLTLEAIKELIITHTSYPIVDYGLSKTIKIWDHPKSLLKEIE